MTLESEIAVVPVLVFALVIRATRIVAVSLITNLTFVLLFVAGVVLEAVTRIYPVAAPRVQPHRPRSDPESIARNCPAESRNPLLTFFAPGTTGKESLVRVWTGSSEWEVLPAPTPLVCRNSSLLPQGGSIS